MVTQYQLKRAAKIENTERYQKKHKETERFSPGMFGHEEIEEVQ